LGKGQKAFFKGHRRKKKERLEKRQKRATDARLPRLKETAGRPGTRICGRQKPERKETTVEEKGDPKSRKKTEKFYLVSSSPINIIGGREDRGKKITNQRRERSHLPAIAEKLSMKRKIHG